MAPRHDLAERYAFLRWLAVPFAVVGAIFGFFALVWTEIPQALVAIGCFGIAVLIWKIFAARGA